MTVTITIKQLDWTPIATFPGEDHISIAQMAKQHDVQFPTSCGIWICGICKCKIVAGHEYVQIDKISPPSRILARDEDGTFQEVLACIWGIKKEALTDNAHHDIILEKHI